MTFKQVCSIFGCLCLHMGDGHALVPQPHAGDALEGGRRWRVGGGAHLRGRNRGWSHRPTQWCQAPGAVWLGAVEGAVPWPLAAHKLDGGPRFVENVGGERRWHIAASSGLEAPSVSWRTRCGWRFALRRRYWLRLASPPPWRTAVREVLRA